MCSVLDPSKYGWAQQEFPNLNHVARGLGLGETPLEGVGRTLR